MARRPNYKFERMERERAKAAKKAAKKERAQARAEEAAKESGEAPTDALPEDTASNE